MLLFLGDMSEGQHEWFSHFNFLFFNHLKNKGFDVNHVGSTSKCKSGYPVRELFKNFISFNQNNLIIANSKTKKCILFTTFFDLRQLKSNLNNFPLDNIECVYSGHYDEKIIRKDWPEIEFKIKPWYFRPWRANSYYEENCYNPKNNNIYYRGLFIPKVRDLLKNLSSTSLPNVDIKHEKISCKNYMEDLKCSRVAFSMSGIRDMCNRDVEYWLAGIPFIRPRFTSKLIVEIPDDVYIPVDWEPEYSTTAGTPIPKDINKLNFDILEKFKEVQYNYELLNKISENGYSFYKKNFTMENIINKSFDLLNSIIT